MMKLLRVPEQGPETLEAFYGELLYAAYPAFTQRARMMLAFVHHLQREMVGPDVWAHTSHEDLVLRDLDWTYSVSISPDANYYALIIERLIYAGILPVTERWPMERFPFGDYRIQCWRQSWPEARLVGRTRDLSEAAQLTIQALQQLALSQNEP
jgi:hypothetical protein